MNMEYLLYNSVNLIGFGRPLFLCPDVLQYNVLVFLLTTFYEHGISSL